VSEAADQITAADYPTDVNIPNLAGRQALNRTSRRLGRFGACCQQSSLLKTQSRRNSGGSHERSFEELTTVYISGHFSHLFQIALLDNSQLV